MDFPYVFFVPHCLDSPTSAWNSWTNKLAERDEVIVLVNKMNCQKQPLVKFWVDPPGHEHRVLFITCVILPKKIKFEVRSACELQWLQAVTTCSSMSAVFGPSAHRLPPICCRATPKGCGEETPGETTNVHKHIVTLCSSRNERVIQKALESLLRDYSRLEASVRVKLFRCCQCNLTFCAQPLSVRLLLAVIEKYVFAYSSPGLHLLTRYQRLSFAEYLQKTLKRKPVGIECGHIDRFTVKRIDRLLAVHRQHEG